MSLVTREHASSSEFRKFKRQLFHSSLSHILWPLYPAMKVPEVVLFGDDYHWQVIYALAAYIADYEEQVLLSCIVQNWCPKCLAYRDNLDEDALQCI
jgi:Plavaka transposase